MSVKSSISHILIVFMAVSTGAASVMSSKSDKLLRDKLNFEVLQLAKRRENDELLKAFNELFKAFIELSTDFVDFQNFSKSVKVIKSY